MTPLVRHYRRIGIGLIGLAWFVIGASYFALMGDPERYAPGIVGMVFVAAATTTFWLTYKPCSEWAFLLAGFLPLAGLVLRFGSIFMGDVVLDSLGWINVSSLAGTAVTFGLFWWFWRNGVTVWHKYHSERCRIEPGKC